MTEISEEIKKKLLMPSKATIAKYGLTVDLWKEIAERQGYVCAVCKKVPESGRLHIEHHHVKGWKKMPPEQRRLFVRGLCCFICNTTFLGRGITIKKAVAVVEYLKEYQKRLLDSGINLDV